MQRQTERILQWFNFVFAPANLSILMPQPEMAL